MNMLSKADYYLSMLIEYKSSTPKSNEKASFSSTNLHPQSMGASFRLWFDNLTLSEKEQFIYCPCHCEEESTRGGPTLNVEGI